MEKRYQVFISSTFQDLEGARQEVSQALLRADCFPAGMELFPAADEETFEYIKEIIRESDYYIIISAGRYGSIPEGSDKSYTEMEYDYAVAIGKPVIRLLHKDPFNRLTGDKIERTDAGKAKLRAFQEKLTNGVLVNFWEEPKELGQLVVFGLMDARKRRPAVGWVKADGMASDVAEREIAELRQEVAELRLENAHLPDAEIDIDHVFDGNAGHVDIYLNKDLEISRRIGLKLNLKNSDDAPVIPISNKNICIYIAAAMATENLRTSIEYRFVELYIIAEFGAILESDIKKSLISGNSQIFDMPTNRKYELSKNFAELIVQGIATDDIVAGFTQIPKSGYGAGPDFSYRRVWKLTPAARASANRIFAETISMV